MLRWLKKRRRLAGFGVLLFGCIYIFPAEVEKSWNRKSKATSFTDSLLKPVDLTFDAQRYINVVKDTRIVVDDFELHAFNHRTSDETAPDRNIPDTRHDRCRSTTYHISDSHTVSVIISFHNEARSALLRTVVSVLNRTPLPLLKEIILVDDFSDDVSDGTELPEFDKVRVLRNSKREGLSRSRMAGVRKASGTHVMFLDSHCEVNTGWLEPLLDTVTKHPKSLVSPVIDIIDTDTFEYKSSSAKLKGGFDWNLNYKWLPEVKQPLDSNSHVEIFRTPVTPGGLFLVNRTWLLELGGLDAGMETWGAENIEMSIKTWLCGGQVLGVPCSRVGHVFRQRHPYTFPSNGSLSTYLKNSKRIAENWLDDYKYQFYDVKPEAKKQNIGSTEEFKKVKKRLRCKSFQWYLDHVYPELKPLSKDALALGQLQQEDTCLQVLTNHHNRTSVLLLPCSEIRKEQDWFFSKSGQLHHDHNCLTASNASKKPKVYISPCSNDTKQKWTRRRRFLVHQGLCLENAMDLTKGRSYLTLNPCRKGAYLQRWDFAVELQSWDDR